ncbi:MAG: prolyl oligopeptidase family serine peptidase [Elusimicrobiales bacterium]|nr:prolyl oligopeptidase family serine peptidase [Elusimicrobiales bacterium]
MVADSLAFKILWRLLFYSALISAVLSFIVFWMYVHPKRTVSASRPESFRLPAEQVELTTADGIKLDAWFIPHKTSKKTVILCHGYPMDKGDILGITVFLAREFNLLYFDFRATGRSGGFFSTGGAREVRDIDAAVKFLEDRGFKDGVGLFGFSLGGATALLSRNPAIKARALDSPFARLAPELDHIFLPWGPWRKPLLALMKVWNFVLLGININSVNPIDNAAAFIRPVLLVHGDADLQVPPSNSLAIKAEYPSAELWIVKGAGHGENWGRAGKEYERRLTEFFKNNI